MFLRRLAVSALILAASVASATRCYAGLIITVGDLSLPQGGTGFVNVTIRSDEASGDSLNLASFQFAIDTLGATQLEFVDPQPDSQLVDAAYVFAGDSFDDAFFLPVGTVSTDVVPNDTFTGGDSTLSGSDVIVTTDRLLARLQVTSATTLPPGAGDKFTIRLITGPSTSFESTGGSVAFSGVDGTVTISPASVPEPSSFCLLLGAAAIGVCKMRRRFWAPTTASHSE